MKCLATPRQNGEDTELSDVDVDQYIVTENKVSAWWCLLFSYNNPMDARTG